jgi:hypothetical protein
MATPHCMQEGKHGIYIGVSLFILQDCVADLVQMEFLGRHQLNGAEHGLKPCGICINRCIL